jgi:hypothetical protein
LFDGIAGRTTQSTIDTPALHWISHDVGSLVAAKLAKAISAQAALIASGC